MPSSIDKSAGECQRFTHQSALAEQRFDQIDGEHGGLVAHIQGGIQFHDVQGGHSARIGDHFHAQLRLTIGQSAGHRGADAGRDFRIEEIHIEAHVQVGIGIHVLQAPIP